MYAAIGIAILFIMVFGGFAITGGALGPVFEAIPHELLIIGGAAAGAMVTGVLLAYGMVSPMAGRLKQVIEADEQIFNAVKQVIIASLHGWPQPLVVESARSGLGHEFRPGLSELLDALRGR